MTSKISSCITRLSMPPFRELKDATSQLTLCSMASHAWNYQEAFKGSISGICLIHPPWRNANFSKTYLGRRGFGRWMCVAPAVFLSYTATTSYTGSMATQMLHI